jgi:mono/diheme cytochrome c family protein
MKRKINALKKNIILVGLCALGATFLSSCHGDKSTEPPIELIRNMSDQTSYSPQSQNTFFKDKQAARPPVAGTVAQGEANTNLPLHEGLKPNSDLKNPQWVTQIPVPITDKIMQRGQERYNIYCAPCHGYAANNDGLATQAAGGTIRPANLHDKDKVALPVGRIYSAITHGVNNWNMPGFAEQMSVEDRWAVVAYVRALQLSQHANPQDVK